MFSGGMEKDQWHETVLHWTESKKWIQKQKSQKQKLDHKKWIYQQSKKSDKIKSNKSNKIWRQILKSFVRYFLKKKIIYHQMIALQKLCKMFFISSKKLFSFSRYSDFCISTFPSFSPCQPLLESLIQDKS